LGFREAQHRAFIPRSQNKPDGTGDVAEHHASAFVVARAIQTTEEDI
jgi:hypothetical protein